MAKKAKADPKPKQEAPEAPAVETAPKPRTMDPEAAAGENPAPGGPVITEALDDGGREEMWEAFEAHQKEQIKEEATEPEDETQPEPEEEAMAQASPEEQPAEPEPEAEPEAEPSEVAKLEKQVKDNKRWGHEKAREAKELRARIEAMKAQQAGSAPADGQQPGQIPPAGAPQPQTQQQLNPQPNPNQAGAFKPLSPEDEEALLYENYSGWQQYQDNKQRALLGGLAQQISAQQHQAIQARQRQEMDRKMTSYLHEKHNDMLSHKGLIDATVEAMSRDFQAKLAQGTFSDDEYALWSEVVHNPTRIIDEAVTQLRSIGGTPVDADGSGQPREKRERLSANPTIAPGQKRKPIPKREIEDRPMTAQDYERMRNEQTPI